MQWSQQQHFTTGSTLKIRIQLQTCMLYHLQGFARKFRDGCRVLRNVFFHCLKQVPKILYSRLLVFGIIDAILILLAEKNLAFVEDFPLQIRRFVFLNIAESKIHNGLVQLLVVDGMNQ